MLKLYDIVASKEDIKEITKEVVKDLYLPKENTHKGENGKVLVIGGSKEYFGAPILVGMAALKIVDWTSVLSVEEVINKIYHPEIIPYSVSGDYISKKHMKYVLNVAEKHDVVVIGNGLGANSITYKFINEFLSKYKGKVVIDADALKVLDIEKFIPNSNIIMTPNANEYKYLENHIKKLLDKGVVIVVKGKEDIVLHKEKIRINRTGNAGMTKGGTGDVLSGIIGALFTRNDAFLSACAGAYINGYIGDMLYKEKGYYYTPLDIIEKLPYALKELILK